MNTEVLKKAVLLSEQLGYVFIVTASSKGIPHVASADKLILGDNNSIKVQAWFCPGTMANIKVNPNISIVVWEDDIDKGFQLIGRLKRANDVAAMDGFSPKIEKKTAIPQIKIELEIVIYEIIDFKHAPHNDVEE